MARLRDYPKTVNFVRHTTCVGLPFVVRRSIRTLYAYEYFVFFRVDIAFGRTALSRQKTTRKRIHWLSIRPSTGGGGGGGLVAKFYPDLEGSA